jgi:general secretion pathway protein F
MQFLVRALDANQRIQTLVVEASDESDAHEQALAQQLEPLSASEKRSLRLGSGAKFPLLLFTQELHALLAAGLSVIEALQTLVEKETQPARLNVMNRLVRELREGQSLSSALARQPQTFPPLFVGIVRAAEGTSDLPASLARYVQYETRLDSVRHKVASAAIYPAILVLAGGAVSLFLLGYVVPRFAAVYQDTGRELPWASALLMGWGRFVSAHALFLLAAAVVAIIALSILVRRRLADGGWWQLLRWLPGTSAKVDAMELSRLYLTLGMLLEGGIAIQQALHLCSAVAPRSRQAALSQLRADITSGYAFSDSLDRHGLSTPVALRLLRVGERSGQLGVMLGRTASFYDEETARWIERFTKAFEPVLMAAIGAVVGLIVILLYMPIFDLAGTLQ